MSHLPACFHVSGRLRLYKKYQRLHKEATLARRFFFIGDQMTALCNFCLPKFKGMNLGTCTALTADKFSLFDPQFSRYASGALQPLVQKLASLHRSVQAHLHHFNVACGPI
eukprot:2054374-Amphidinium_carterae.1